MHAVFTNFYMEPIKNINHFIETQLPEWEMASSNYNDLKNVKTKTFLFNGFEILVQFNPKRITSSAAKVDVKSIEARPCFLCAQNRPMQQRSLPFKDDYQILVNPFPIFPRHLTIPKEQHTDQLIQLHFGDMLDLAYSLDDFVVFYNGPKCGASAPDHFHFQAGSKGFLPIEKDFHNTALVELVKVKQEVKIYQSKDYLRSAITLQSSNKESIALIFSGLYNDFHLLQPTEVEPMLNILAYFEKGEWIVHIFPRILHRPAQYFAQGEGQILLSPASVDMGGVFITPREEDFNKISMDDIADIFTQVCMDEITLHKLINRI